MLCFEAILDIIVLLMLFRRINTQPNLVFQLRRVVVMLGCCVDQGWGRWK